MPKKSKTFLSKSINSAIGIILLLLITALVNILFTQVNASWDISEDKLFSLSDNTKNIVSGLNNTVTVELFYSKSAENIPIHLKQYAKRVSDFLKEYQKISSNKFILKFHNPKPDSEEEEWANLYGLQALTLPSQTKIYFGLVIYSKDKEEIISFLDVGRESNLEYDITQLIYKAQLNHKRKIGILSRYPVFGTKPDPRNPASANQPPAPSWNFITELEKTYDIIEINAEKTTSIDQNLDLLILIDPKQINKKLLHSIDQYFINNKNMIIFADPVSIISRDSKTPMPFSIGKLLSAWNIKINIDNILIDFDYAAKTRGKKNKIENNPMWISIPEKGFNQNNIITSQLENMLLPACSGFLKPDNAEYEFIPLLTSSKNTALENKVLARTDPEQIRTHFKSTNKNFAIAALIKGNFPSAFNNKTANTDTAKKSNDIKSVQKNKDSLLLMVLDSDLLVDTFYIQKQNFFGQIMTKVFNDNLNFLLNTCEFLTGSRELIKIRSRGLFQRPFTKIHEIEKNAEKKWMAKEQELTKQAELTKKAIIRLEQLTNNTQESYFNQKQQDELLKFEEKSIEIKKNLKIVRKNMQTKLDSLKSKIKFINILLIPFLVAFCGIAFALYKRFRKKEM